MKNIGSCGIERKGENMKSNEKLTNESGIAQLSNEMTYRRYLMNRTSLKKINNLATADYIVVSMAAKADEEPDSNKVYLAEIAEQIQLPIHKASKLISNLKDRGLVKWSHDGNGSEGTYITITETGKEAVIKQDQRLQNFYGKVVQKFGKEKFINFLQMMNELEEIMNEEIVKEED